MWHVTKIAALAIIFSISAPDVQEQNSVEDTTDSPPSVRLNPEVKMEDNYPNPFWARTGVSFTLSKDDSVKIELFSIKGESVGVKFDGFLEAGNHRIFLDMGGLISGVYFYRLTTPDTSITDKMMLLK